MKRDFQQFEWDAATAEACRRVAVLAFDEDLAGEVDHSAMASVPETMRGRTAIVARQPGIAAGLQAVQTLAEVFGADLQVDFRAADGQTFGPGDELARIEGRVRDILALERTVLNVLGKLAGIATQTRRYVDAIAGTGVRLYDTRKTTPGWRLLEKYAVRCGGGYNHRAGLYAAILIKDNHIAAWSAKQEGRPGQPSSLAELARSVRDYVQELSRSTGRPPLLIEVEVDNVRQLEEVLAGGPDLILLDNFNVTRLREAVQIRDRTAPDVELEASGGITLDSIREIATTGIERISVGGLTHQAVWLDVGLDWAER